MERLDLLLTHAAALFFGALMLRVAAVRILRAELRHAGLSATPYFQKALRDRLYGAPMALLVVPAFEEFACRFPLMFAIDRPSHPYAIAAVIASASAFAASRFMLAKAPLPEMPADADAHQRQRMAHEKSRDFATRVQAFAVGFCAGILLGALALQTQNLLALFAVHVIGKFTIHRVLGIFREL